jgi:hypothetical protein
LLFSFSDYFLSLVSCAPCLPRVLSAHSLPFLTARSSRGVQVSTFPPRPVSPPFVLATKANKHGRYTIRCK